eukprot:PhF_6_TR7852/c0_g1_i1/m.11455
MSGAKLGGYCIFSNDEWANVEIEDLEFLPVNTSTDHSNSVQKFVETTSSEVFRSLWTEQCFPSLVVPKKELINLWNAIRIPSQAFDSEGSIAEIYEIRMKIILRVLASQQTRVNFPILVPSSSSLKWNEVEVSPVHDVSFTMLVQVICCLGLEKEEISEQLLHRLMMMICELKPFQSQTSMSPLTDFLVQVLHRYPRLKNLTLKVMILAGLAQTEPLKDAVFMQGVVGLLKTKDLEQETRLSDFLTKLSTTGCYVASQSPRVTVHLTKIRVQYPMSGSSSRPLAMCGRDNDFIVSGNSVGYVKGKIIMLPGEIGCAARVTETCKFPLPEHSNAHSTIMYIDGDVVVASHPGKLPSPTSALTILFHRAEKNGTVELNLDDSEFRFDHALIDRSVAPWMYRRKLSISSNEHNLFIVIAYNPLQMRRTGLVTLTTLPLSVISQGLNDGQSKTVMLTNMNTMLLQRNLRPLNQVTQTTSSLMFARSTCVSIGRFHHGGPSAVLQMCKLCGEFTVECWLFVLNLDEPRQFYYHGERDSGDVFAELIPTDVGATWKITRRVSGSSNLTASYDVCGKAQILNTWCHFAASYSAQGWCMYIDGLQVAASNKLPTKDLAMKHNHPLCQWTLGKSFIGVMTEFRLWSTCRTSDLIQRDMRRRLCGQESGLMVLLSMNEGRGHILYDKASGIHALVEDSVPASWTVAVEPPLAREGIKHSDINVPEFSFSLCGNVVVGAEHFTSTILSNNHLGVFLFPPEGGQTLPKCSIINVYDLKTGMLVQDQWLEAPLDCDSSLGFYYTPWFDPMYQSLWVPYVNEMKELALLRLADVDTTVTFKHSPDSSFLSSLCSTLRAYITSRSRLSKTSGKSKMTCSGATLSYFNEILKHDLSSSNFEEILRLMTAVLESTELLGFNESILESITESLQIRLKNEVSPEITKCVNKLLVATLQSASRTTLVSTLLKSSPTLSLYHRIEYSATLTVLCLPSHITFLEDIDVDEFIHCCTFLLNITGNIFFEDESLQHSATRFLFHSLKYVAAKCMKDAPQLSSQARWDELCSQVCIGVLKTSDNVLLQACQHIRQHPTIHETNKILRKADRFLLRSVLPFMVHALPVLRYSVIMGVVDPLNKLLAETDDLIQFIGQLPYEVNDTWLHGLVSVIMYCAARVGVSMMGKHIDTTEAEVLVWLSTNLFSGGLTFDSTNRQALVRSIYHGTIPLHWENGTVKHPSSRGEAFDACQRAILAAFVNILATEAEILQFSEQSKWFAETEKLSLFLRQVRQEESTGNGTLTIASITKRALLLCKLEPAGIAAGLDAKSRVGTYPKPKGRVQNWKRVFQIWKALKKVHALMHMQRATSNSQETVHSQIIRFLKSDIDARSIEQAMSRRTAISEQRCTGIHAVTDLICNHESKECLPDILKLIAATLQEKHYLSDLLACGAESAGRVQAAIHHLFSQILDKVVMWSTEQPKMSLVGSYLSCLDLPWESSDYTCLLRYDFPKLLLTFAKTKVQTEAPLTTNTLSTLGVPVHIKILTDNLTVRSSTGSGSVRSLEAWTRTTKKLHYFEITIVDMKPGYTVSIGLGSKLYNLQRHPGWDEGSIAYHSDDGMVYHESGTGCLQGPTFGLGHTVGVGFNPETCEVFFTKNGKMTSLRLTFQCTECFPMIGVDHSVVRVNFGATPFRYSTTDVTLPQHQINNSSYFCWQLFCALATRTTTQVAALLEGGKIASESDPTIIMLSRVIHVLCEQINENIAENSKCSEILSPVSVIAQGLCVPNIKLPSTLRNELLQFLERILQIMVVQGGHLKRVTLKCVRHLLMHFHPNEVDEKLKLVLSQPKDRFLSSYNNFVEFLFACAQGIIKLNDKDLITEIALLGDRSRSHDFYATYFGWEALLTLRYLYFSNELVYSMEFRACISMLFSRILSVHDVRMIGLPSEALTALCVLHGIRDPPMLGATVTLSSVSPHAKTYDGELQLLDYSLNTGCAEVATNSFLEKKLVSVNALKFTNAYDKCDNIGLTTFETTRRFSIASQSEVDPILHLLKELLADVRDQMTYVWWCLVTRLLRSLNYFLQFSAVRLRVVQLNLLPSIISMCQYVNQVPDQLWSQTSGNTAATVEQLEEREHQLNSLLWTFPSRLPSLVSLQPRKGGSGYQESTASIGARLSNASSARESMQDEAMQAAQELSLHGFPIEMCVVALEHSNYNRAEALKFLTEHPDLESLLYHAQQMMSGDDEAVEEEEHAEEEEDEYEDLDSDDESRPDIGSGVGGYFSISAHPDITSVLPDTPPSPKGNMSTVAEVVENGLYFSGGRVVFPGCGSGPDLISVTIDVTLRLASFAMYEAQVIFSHGVDEGRLTLKIEDNQILFAVRVDRKYETVCKASFGLETLGNLCHITLVGEAGTWSMYQDSVHACSSLRTTTPRIFHDQWCLGAMLDGGLPLTGEILEFQVWSSLLDQMQIERVCQGEPVSLATQVLHYKFDEGSGTSVQNSVPSVRWSMSGEIVGNVEWLQSKTQPGNCYAVVMETELTSLQESETEQSATSGNEFDKYDLWKYFTGLAAPELGDAVQDTCRMLAVQYACNVARQVLSSWPAQIPLTANAIGGAVNLCKLIRVTCDDERSETLSLLKSTLTAIIENQPPQMASRLVNVFAEEFLSLLSDEPKIVLYESRHPPTETELSVVHEVNNPGYNHYTIWFDPRCSLLQGHHQLTFYSDSDLTQVIARYGGTGNNYGSTLHIHSSRFFFDLKAESGSGLWGFRFFVQYSGERFALGLEFIEQLIALCNKSSDPTIGHALRTRRTFNSLVQAACRSTGRFRRKACSVLRQLLQSPELFLECERPDVSVLNDLRATLERQFRRETDTPLHSKFVQSVTEMFVAVKDAELIWRAPPDMNDSSTLSGLEDVAESNASFLAKRTEVRRFYSHEYRLGKERVFVERVGVEFGRIEQNVTDQSVMVWSEYAGCTIKADVTLFRGKWYFEVKLLSGGDANIGFVTTSYIGGLVGISQDTWGYNGKKQVAMSHGRTVAMPNRNANASRAINVRRWKAKDVLGVALDIDGGEIHYYLNGSHVGSLSLEEELEPEWGDTDSTGAEEAILKENNTNWVAAFSMTSPTFATAARSRANRINFQSPITNSNQPDADTTAVMTGYIPALSLGSDEGVSINFGSTYFEHEPPASFYAVDVANFGMGSLLPFNQLRAFVDISNSLLHERPLPPFFHDEIDPFINDKRREGPSNVGVLADDGVVSNGLDVRNAGTSFSGARAECKVYGGQWYYEVSLNSQGLMQIGWITSKFESDPGLGKGVGDDSQSWAIDLYRRLAWHNGTPTAISCARSWNVGDIIGCAIDIDAKEMMFSINGRWLTDAHGSDVIFRGFSVAEGFIPAVTLRANNNCVFNFGATAFKHRLDRFKPLGVTDTWLERVDLFYSTASAKDVKRRLALSSTLNLHTTRLAPPKRSVELAIVALVDEMYVRYNKSIHQLSFNNTSLDFVLHDELISTFPELTQLSRDELQHRFLILKHINKLFATVFPTIYFDGATHIANSFAMSVVAFRGYAFRAVRAELVKGIMKATNGRGEHVKISINRAMAARHKQSPEEDPEGRRSLFGQTHSLLSNANSRMFRTNQRFWSVVFAGEGAEDVGGPFREHIAEMCSELMSKALPLFVATQNNQHNVGKSRECFFPAHKSTSPLHLSMYRFLGQLMGGAMRSGEPLGLYFPSLLWKRLVRQPVDVTDLEAVDHLCVQCVANVRNIDSEGSETFDAMFATETFTTIMCDDTVVELVEFGQQTPLTFDRRAEYCDLVIKTRLKEAEMQIEAMRVGLVSVIPENLLALMTADDIEFKVCGQPDFTVQELMNSTTYEGLSKDDKRVQYLWEVLANATPTDRRNFLKFVSGRERLPVRLRILAMNVPSPSPTQGGGSENVMADTYLPKAATCFFALELPPYSSVDIMREKLLYAVNHCGDMDTDFRALEQDENEAPYMAVETHVDSDLGGLLPHMDDFRLSETEHT